MTLQKILFALILILLAVSPVLAENQKLGIHILEPEEIDKAGDLLPHGGWVTVPLRLDQLDQNKWQQFFDQADQKKLTPIIRFLTWFDNENWARPTKKDIVDYTDFLNKLDWHNDQLIIIAFNEPNQQKEWGGQISPQDYGETLTFTLNWLKTEKRSYLVLPAALDWAADGKNGTMKADLFLNYLINNFPDTLKSLDGWNSHAYPNPGFSGLPTDKHSMSVRSYIWERNLLKTKLNLSLPVYITETGWDKNKKSDQLIANYFEIVYKNLWAKDNDVITVMPFLLNAPTGDFVGFSLLNADGSQSEIYKRIKSLAN